MAGKQRSVANSVCLNHPDRPAATRCDVCFKPICNECAIATSEGTFCSEKCARNYEGTKEGVDQWQARRDRERSRRRRRRVITLIILLGLAAAAYWYFSRNPGEFDQLRNKAGSTVQDVKGRMGR